MPPSSGPKGRSLISTSILRTLDRVRRTTIGPIHCAVGVLLLTSANGCSHKVVHATTMPTDSYPAVINACVVDKQDDICQQICRDVFGSTYDGTRCTVKTDGDETRVSYEEVVDDSGSPPREPGCAPGRRPAGLASMARLAGPVAGVYLAWCAQMEAASITAFARVHDDLRRRGARADLLARVGAAAGDELVHAQLAVGLARRYGVNPPAPVIAPEREVALVDRAIENAVEGCVGETVAAIEAAFIAVSCPDPVVAQAFARIARDEADHAALSYELAAEYARWLGAGERARVRAAFADATLRRANAAVGPGPASLGVHDGAGLRATIVDVLAAMAPRFEAALAV